MAAPFVALLLAGAWQAGGGCDTLRARVVPANIGTPTVRAVVVRTNAASDLPVFGGYVAALRRTTEAGVVARQLLFAAGQPFDSARVEETLRRLRARGQYADVSLALAFCAAARDSVDVVVMTRDAWTLRPVARVVPPSTVALGAQDANFLGSGRSFSAAWERSARGEGGSLGFTDPWFLGANIVAAGRVASVGGSHVVSAQLRRHERSVLDRWRFDAAFTRDRFASLPAAEHPLATLSSSMQVGRLIHASERATLVAYAGAELDSARNVEQRPGDAAPTEHARDFTGAELGVARRAVRFDTLGWIAPGHGISDVPASFELDALVAPGYDAAQRADAMRYDAWAGRIWLPQAGRLVALDGWTSGFLGNVRGNAVSRASLTALGQATRGYWGARALVEQMVDADPDLRTLSLAIAAYDPAFGALPRPVRLGHRAAAASVERAARIADFARGPVVDGGVFAAGSLRWDIPNDTQRRFAVTVVGARLEMLAGNGLITRTRVDVGYPVLANGAVVRRPLLSVSVAPLYDLARSRDGNRRLTEAP